MVALIVPPLALLPASGVVWGVPFSWIDVVLLVSLYVVCAFGTTVGFHRLFTHRSFEAHPAVRATLAILGCMTMQGGITQWVTDHRKHHALTDRPGDPHSPHAGYDGKKWGAARGFAHAHVGWLFSNLGMEDGAVYGKDLYADRMIVWIDRLYFLWIVLTFGIPFSIGYAVGGSWKTGLAGLVWGGLLRIFLYQHATFSVNSVCHVFGRRSYPTRDQSRNNPFVAALVFGEGWHNNHHAFPASARQGLERRQIDVSWWLIRALERLGLAWNVRVPSAERRARKRVGAAAS
ncbi:MAG: acyl-CoA desaturase [Gaiellaceae bacterium]